MDSYSFLAEDYDVFTRDVDYVRYANFVDKYFKKSKLPIRTVLDLACGTGSLTALLMQKGYEMICVDLSTDMLQVAFEKCNNVQGIKPLLLNQSMDKLDLYGTIDGCVCSLDSVNYVTNPNKLRRAFERIHLFMLSGGRFILDFRPESFFKKNNNQVFCDESENTLCIWKSNYSEKNRINTYDMDLFYREDNLWSREKEIHKEYGYTVEEIKRFLADAGFINIKMFGTMSGRKLSDSDDRVYVVCQRG